jgi:hypothetical protein
LLLREAVPSWERNPTAADAAHYDKCSRLKPFWQQVRPNVFNPHPGKFSSPLRDRKFKFLDVPLHRHENPLFFEQGSSKFDQRT